MIETLVSESTKLIPLAPTKEFRAGMVGLVGLPNSGKSSFLNQVVVDKIAIVTPKPQTTRRRQIGLVNRPLAQMAIVDSPGLVDGEKGLFKYLHQEAREVAEESDTILVLIGIDTAKKEDIDQLVEFVVSLKRPWCLGITKVDLEPYVRRIIILEEIARKHGVPCFRLTTEKASHSQAEEALAYLEKQLPVSPAPLFDTEILTTATLRELASEIVREKCLLTLHDEIPYGLGTQVRNFDETRTDLTRISVDIWVPKESHKGILIGKKGQTLKEIGSLARKDIEKLTGTPVFLDLHVVIKENWQDRQIWMKDLGYTIKKTGES